MTLFKPLSHHGDIVAHGFLPVLGLVSIPKPPDEDQEDQRSDDHCKRVGAHGSSTFGNYLQFGNTPFIGLNTLVMML